MITVNNIEINVTKFNDQTSQVWQLPPEILDSKVYKIKWDFESEAEIFHLHQLVSLLRFKQVPRPMTLDIPFLPYGRQDKELSNESTFALRNFATILNSLNLDKITSIDTHSNVAAELINNFENIYPAHSILQAILDCNCDTIAFPDKGACDRYEVTPPYGTIIGFKKRNQLTGYIEQYIIEGDAKDKIVLIQDDLCDGGMTFKLMAEQLYKDGAKEVHLYVSHGIFSKGLPTLRASGIKRIFTKDGEVDKVYAPSNELIESELSNM